MFENPDDDGQPQPGGPQPVSFPVALLGLGSVNGLGQKGLQGLVTRYGDDLGAVLWQPEAVVAEVFAASGVSGADKLAATIIHDPQALIRRGEDEWRELQARNVRILPPSRIPERLQAINGEAPRWLCVEGCEAVLTSRPVVAVVGTRTPSEQGLEATRVVASILSAYPIVMVSGLADGIDGQAHHHSLSKGVTNLAFLGHGVNVVYPQETLELRRVIVNRGGAAASEYLPSQHANKRQFVERNRLQAAMADIVIPVEAAATSGTAHTVRFARRYARALVGLSWKGASGVVDDLREHKDRVIDIFTPTGQKELDRLFQDLLTEHRGDPYPFRSIERFAVREFNNRVFTDADVKRLAEALTREAAQRTSQEQPGDGTA